MPYPVIVVPFMRVDGMAIYPFILLRKAAYKDDEVLIRHETIHLRQQLELFILPFYLLYLVNYIINRSKHKHDKAYREIVFEREAYQEERNPYYLRNRKVWSWMHY